MFASVKADIEYAGAYSITGHIPLRAAIYWQQLRKEGVGDMVIVLKKRTIALVCLCCAALILIPVASKLSPAAVESSASVNWGLSFQKEGAPPTGNATAEALRQQDAWYVDSRGEKVIYLTFDAGFESGCTPAILDALQKHNVKAAFFLVGNYLNTAPDLVKRMVAEGHIVGNHTFHHPDMSAISDKTAFQAELSELESLYKEVTGQEMPKYYRPPQGKYSAENLKQAKELGYKTIFWSLAYVDWYQDKQPTPQQAFDKLIPRIHPGAVVLLHSTSQTNADILDELLTRWEELGYRFGTLDELTA